jgi:hypothetical protein
VLEVSRTRAMSRTASGAALAAIAPPAVADERLGGVGKEVGGAGGGGRGATTPPLAPHASTGPSLMEALPGLGAPGERAHDSRSRICSGTHMHGGGECVAAVDILLPWRSVEGALTCTRMLTHAWWG